MKKKSKKMPLAMGKTKQHAMQKGPPPLLQAPGNMMSRPKKRGRSRS